MNFSLVSYLVGDEFNGVRKLQEELSAITGSRKCLNDWSPHITVGDGIVIEEDELKDLELKLQDFCEGREKITGAVTGFGGIDNWKGAIPEQITPYVIWLNVEVSAPLLKLFENLRDEVTQHHDTWLPRTVNFVPHITLAFADLSEDGYQKGMDYLKNKDLEFVFDINHVALTECYGVGNMTSREHRRFDFGSNIVH